MKGPAPMPQVGAELTPGIVVFNGNENRYLEGWDMFGAFVSQAPVAAQLSRAQIRNPSGSNVIAVITKVTIAPVAADTIDIGNQITADLGTLQATAPDRFDARGRPNSTCQISKQAAAGGAPGATFFNCPIPISPPYDLIVDSEQEIPLLPGDGLQVFDTTVNIGLNVSFFWRERFLEDSERA